MNANTLILSGGSVRGFALLGAIQYMQDKTWLNNIRKIIGTSIGAILGYLICIGYAPVELMVILCQNNFLDKLSHLDLLSGINGSGAASFSIIQDVLEKLTIQKIGRFITMEELLRQYGYTLVCCTYNQTAEKAEYIGPDNYPDMPCLVALRMSASLPLLFEPFMYNGSVYIDGGVIDNLPVVSLLPEDNAIALRLLSARRDNKQATFTETMMDIIRIPVRLLEEINIEKVGHRCLVVPIRVNLSMLNFNLNQTEKFDLFSTGYNRMRDRFDNVFSS